MTIYYGGDLLHEAALDSIESPLAYSRSHQQEFVYEGYIGERFDVQRRISFVPPPPTNGTLA